MPKLTDPDRAAPTGQGTVLLPALVVGGLIGLAVGLVAWAWSPGGGSPVVIAAAESPGAIVTRSGPGTLSGDDSKAQARPASEAGESPRATATRHAWSTRVLLDQYEEALAIADDPRLQPAERDGQLADLLGELVRHEWLNRSDYPRSPEIEELVQEPGGRERVVRRWNVAVQAAGRMGESAQKVRYLSRLELFANALDHAIRESRSVALEEVSDLGAGPSETTKTEPADSAPALSESKPLLDVAKETAALRAEAERVIARLDTQPRRSALAWAGLIWNASRTALLAMSGALISAVGALLLKSYSELIAQRWKRISPLHRVLDEQDAVAGSGGTS